MMGSMAENESPNKLLMAPQPTNGPLVGALIVIMILFIGALYFGTDRLQKNGNARNQVPYIPSSTTTVTIIKTSTTTYYQYSTSTTE